LAFHEKVVALTAPAVSHAAALDAGTALLILLLTFWAFCQRTAHDVTGFFNDDGIYVATAGSLAQGHGYRLPFAEGQPKQSKYPPVYPLLLAAILFACGQFPASISTMQTVSAGLASIGFAGVYLLVRKKMGAPVLPSLLGVLAAALCPQSTYTYSLILSECLFLPLLVGAFWLATRAVREPDGAVVDVLLGLILALLAMTRLIGVFVGLGILTEVWRRRRDAWRSAAVLAVALGSWGMWLASARGTAAQPDAYATDYLGWWMQFTSQQFAVVVRSNLVGLGLGPGILLLGSPLEMFSANVFMVPAALTFCVIFWIGTVRALWIIQLRVVAAGVGAYLLAVLVWPWPPYRFVLTLTPILAAVALAYFFDRLRDQLGNRAAVVLTATIFVPLLGADLAINKRHSDLTLATGLPLPNANPASASWSAFQEMFDWMRINLPDQSAVVSTVHPMPYLYAGRLSIQPLPEDTFGYNYGPTGTFGDFGSYFLSLRARGATHLLRVHAPQVRAHRAFELIVADGRSACPSAFVSLHKSSNSGFEVLKFDWERLRQCREDNGSIR
jgi:hypothetical protein